MFNEHLVTLFPNGFGNVGPDSIMNALRQAFAPRYHTFFDDFDTYTAGQWTVTETDAGATQALADGDGGWLLITNTATEDDLVSMQKVGESFLLETGKKAFYEARFKISNVTQSDFLMGLIITDTSPFDATDGIFFQSDDGDALLDIYCRQNTAVETSALGIATLVDDTFVTVSWFYDGIATLYYGVNGVVLGSIATTSTLPNTELTVTMTFQNGSAGAKTMTIDYVYAAKERG